MSNAIKKEQELADSKDFKTILYGDKKLVIISCDNVALAETMIRNDSAYIKSLNISAEPEKNKKGKVIYGGSSAFWMNQLKKHLLDGGQGSDYSYQETIKGAVESVDRENSTHINADRCGRREITNRLINLEKEKLLNNLKYPENGKELIEEISRKTKAK